MVTVNYTTAAKVAAYLQRPEFTALTTPTSTTVESYINYAESEIERKTNQAFRAVTETDEIHTMRVVGDGRYRRRYWYKPFIKLSHQPLYTFTSGTDYIYVWNGSAWVDWVATKTEGRDADYWVDTANGIIYFMKGYPMMAHPDNVKVTYRWGNATVAGWAEELATMMAAVRVLEFDQDRVVSAEGGSGDAVDFPRLDSTLSAIKAEIQQRIDENKWLNRRRKFVIN